MANNREIDMYRTWSYEDMVDEIGRLEGKQQELEEKIEELETEIKELKTKEDQ